MSVVGVGAVKLRAADNGGSGVSIVLVLEKQVVTKLEKRLGCLRRVIARL